MYRNLMNLGLTQLMVADMCVDVANNKPTVEMSTEAATVVEESEHAVEAEA